MASLCSTSSNDCSRNLLPYSEFLHQVLNGYFVHYFAPKDLPPLPKNVVFVLDISASMVGAKLQQVSAACPLLAQASDWDGDLPCE